MGQFVGSGADDMTERELKKLSRTDLVEMMLELSRENQKLREELEQQRQQLNQRTIAVEKAGSLAEAAMELSGVFQAAQAAADQYLENLRQRSEEQEQICARMEQETRIKCNRMMMAAQRQAEEYLQQANLPVSQMDFGSELDCAELQGET